MKIAVTKLDWLLDNIFSPSYLGSIFIRKRIIIIIIIFSFPPRLYYYELCDIMEKRCNYAIRV